MAKRRKYKSPIIPSEDKLPPLKRTKARVTHTKKATRSHFESLASVVRELHLKQDSLLDWFLDEICDALAQTNPQFDRAKFINRVLFKYR